MLSRRPSSKLCFLLLLSFCLFPAGLFAQQQTGSIQGQLALSSGEHAERVLVSLEFRGSPIHTTYTTEEGRFSFYELPHNMYHIVVRAKDYQPVDRIVIVRPNLNPITQVLIVLRPLRKNNSDEDAPPEPISGGNPNLVSAENYKKDFPPEAVKEFEAGIKDAEKGKTDNALKHYRKAIELAPTFYPAFNNMGALYLARKDFEAAEEAFREAIRLNDVDANAYFNLGNVCFLTQRYGQAEQALRDGLLREALSPLGNYLLGAVLVRTGALSDSEHLLRKALSLDPNMPIIYLELANLYLMQQRNDEAAEQLREFVKLFPDSPMAGKAKEVLERLEKPSAAVVP